MLEVPVIKRCKRIVWRPVAWSRSLTVPGQSRGAYREAWESCGLPVQTLYFSLFHGLKVLDNQSCGLFIKMSCRYHYMERSTRQLPF